MKLRTSLVALGMVAAILTWQGTARAADLTIDTQDGARHAIVLGAGGGPKPTVIVLHGGSISAEATIRSSGFAQAAARRGFVAVFPEGIGKTWNDGRSGGQGSGADDASFLRVLSERLVSDGIAAPRRLYIAGISNGGMMSFTMVCKSSELFAGIGTVIANMPAGIGGCSTRVLPLVMINGTADPMVPYEGGNVGLRGGRGAVLSVDETASGFIRRNGCGSPSEQPLAQRGGDETAATRISFSGCRAPVVLYRIEGGGHQVAGTRPFLPRLLGPSNQDVSAADAIMSVFAGR